MPLILNGTRPEDVIRQGRSTGCYWKIELLHVFGRVPVARLPSDIKTVLRKGSKENRYVWARKWIKKMGHFDRSNTDIKDLE